jgi:hypothetical protein
MGKRTALHHPASRHRYPSDARKHVTLGIRQIRDDLSGAVTNERYEIITVHGIRNLPRQKQVPGLALFLRLLFTELICLVRKALPL